MRSHRKCGYHINSFSNTFLPTKAECVVFYCLLVHIMYIIHNKAMFIVRENPKAYIRVNINPINNHLLALERIEYWSGSHNISAISFLSFTTILHILK